MQEAISKFWEFFMEFGSYPSLALMLFLTVAFLIGLITAWLFWRRRWKRLKGELDLKSGELINLQSQYDAQTSALELKEADLKKAELEIQELRARIRQLEEEKGRLHSEIITFRQDLDGLNTEKSEFLEKEKIYLSRLDDFDNQILGLKTKNQSLAAKVDQDTNALNELAQLQSKFNDATSQNDALEKELAELKLQLQAQSEGSISKEEYDSLKTRYIDLEEANTALSVELEKANDTTELDDLNAKLQGLSSENEDLKNRLAQLEEELKEKEAAIEEVPIVKSVPIEVIEDEEEVEEEVEEEEIEEVSAEEKAAKAQAEVRAALGNSIPVATADQKDDLKLINGIGPFIEEKLNKLGIYTFEQVASFDSDMVEKVTDAIQFFPGRIERDDWVGQARALMGQKTEGVVMKSVPTQDDDLKVVEGIGPKIEQLLKSGGIHSWNELASTPVSKLQELLVAAGSRYQMHKPDSWPQQAGLAAQGKWDELKELQDYLVGGKNPKKK